MHAHCMLRNEVSRFDVLAVSLGSKPEVRVKMERDESFYRGKNYAGKVQQRSARRQDYRGLET